MFTAQLSQIFSDKWSHRPFGKHVKILKSVALSHTEPFRNIQSNQIQIGEISEEKINKLWNYYSPKENIYNQTLGLLL